MKIKNSARFIAGLGEHISQNIIRRNGAASQQLDEAPGGTFIYATALSTLSAKKPLSKHTSSTSGYLGHHRLWKEMRPKTAAVERNKPRNTY